MFLITVLTTGSSLPTAWLLAPLGTAMVQLGFPAIASPSCLNGHSKPLLLCR